MRSNGTICSYTVLTGEGTVYTVPAYMYYGTVLLHDNSREERVSCLNKTQHCCQRSNLRLFCRERAIELVSKVSRVPN